MIKTDFLKHSISVAGITIILENNNHINGYIFPTKLNKKMINLLPNDWYKYNFNISNVNQNYFIEISKNKSENYIGDILTNTQIAGDNLKVKNWYYNDEPWLCFNVTFWSLHSKKKNHIKIWFFYALNSIFLTPTAPTVTGNKADPCGLAL